MEAAENNLLGSSDFPTHNENEPATPIVIGENGKAFHVPGQTRVDISRRRPLARILLALARQAETAPGEAMTTLSLIAAGWPGERLVRNAGRIRLRVAIATLRSMGLTDHIITMRTGYRLAVPMILEHGGIIEVPPSRTIVPPAMAEAEAAAALEAAEVAVAEAG